MVTMTYAYPSHPPTAAPTPDTTSTSTTLTSTTSPPAVGPRRGAAIAWLFVVALAVAALAPRADTGDIVDDPTGYQSTARVLVGTGLRGDSEPLGDEMALATSPEVGDIAAQRLGFRAEIKAWATAGSGSVFMIAAVDADPVVAQRIAQTYAESFIDAHRENEILGRIEAAEQMTDRVRALDREIAASPGANADLQDLRDDLLVQLDRLVLEDEVSRGNARIIDDANLPTSPLATDSALRHPLAGGPLATNLARGALAAIVLSALLWVPLGRLDRAQVAG